MFFFLVCFLFSSATFQILKEQNKRRQSELESDSTALLLEASLGSIGALEATIEPIYGATTRPKHVI